MNGTVISGNASAPQFELATIDDIHDRISVLQRNLAINAADFDRSADRLEVELRLAAELPSVDTAAFAAAQRQRLGALQHARAGMIAELAELKRRMGGTFMRAPR
ncbi:hypothetical protein KCG44_12810 [Pacificimonas sp. WHA3]|uniref:Uncharacterized protein n=1 Tax=Pacificimonas pallii TaxID=2827236 RepID=A0ABS6SIA6_9SPHN|nr:hypothetical protein [Pacificimonas pallii]MBV7257666.1 hypothetical protein [Pacificimonas pallii]